MVSVPQRLSRMSGSRHQSAESTNETEDGEVVAGAPENLREFHDLKDLKLDLKDLRLDLKDLKLSGNAHKKRLRAKQKERSDEELNVIVRKLGKAVEGLGSVIRIST